MGRYFVEQYTRMMEELPGVIIRVNGTGLLYQVKLDEKYAVRPHTSYGLWHGVWPMAWGMAYGMGHGLWHGLWPTAWAMAYGMGYGL